MRDSRLLRYLLQTGAILLIAYVTLYPVYLHHTWNYPPERQRQTTEQNLVGRGVGHTPKDIVIWMADKPALRPWAQYFSGLFEAVLRSTAGNNPFYMGKIYESGLRSYFPVVYLIKEPLALHVMTVVTLLFAFSRIRLRPLRREWLRAHFTEFALLFAIAVYWFVSIRSNLNIGVRHLLPVRISHRFCKCSARANPSAIGAFAPAINDERNEHEGLHKGDRQPPPKGLA